MHSFQKFGTPSCPEDLSAAMKELEAKSQSPSGREEISKALGSCEDLQNETSAGSKADFFIRGVASTLAMLDYPVPTNFLTPLPANPVKVACQHIARAGHGSLWGLRALIDLFLNATAGGYRCYDLMAEMVGNPTKGDLHGPTTPPEAVLK